MNYRNTLVISPAFGMATLPAGVQWMLESAERHGIEVTLVGQGQPYVNLSDAKISRLWAATKDLVGYDHVVMVDAVDTLFAADLPEMHRGMEAYGCDFVISGEISNWPWPRRYRDHPQASERFGGLNSGFYMATWDGYRRTLGYLAEEQRDDGYAENDLTIGNFDQAAFWRAYMEGLPMQVDHRCLLSQCMNHLDLPWESNADMEWGRRPVNRLTGSLPCTFHANGRSKWRLPELRRRLAGR